MSSLRRAPLLIIVSVVFFAIIACGTAAATGAPPATSEGLSGILEQPSSTPQPAPTETPIPSSTPLPAPSFADPSGYAWVEVANGFDRPLLLTNAGDGSGRLFVVEQDGKIWVLENGNTLAEPFLNISGEVGSQGNEQGLLGLAFHSDYESNGSFYVNYTDLNGDTVVSKFQVSNDPNLADPNTEQVLLQVAQPYPNHNGGHLIFGPDGYLWIGLGDGGSGGDPQGNGQSLETLLGKMLRIDVNSGSPYAIPPDNPFVNGGGLPEIWASGLRNPWRYSFDAATSDLYIGDVGQGDIEEISFLPGGIVGGSNFGWKYYEGTQNYEGSPPEGVQFIFPVAEYHHANQCSVTGGYVYRGLALSAWQGVYFYGDYCSGEIWGLLQHSDGNWENQLLYTTAFNITSFGVDENNELYVVDRGGGIYILQSQ